MEKPKEVLKIFEKYTPLVDREIKTLLSEQSNLPMYDMMSYFFGYLDQDLNKTEYYGGKRFRPGLCLLFADFYGVMDQALESAASIEIFHNFTLIHDDIADHDEVRRDRPTVWKLWGVNHGINTGDAQLLLVDEELMKFIKKDPVKGVAVKEFANRKYLEVAEGQYLDFYLGELPINDPKVTEERNMEMIGKKSGVLVGVATAVPGIIAGVSEAEKERLYEYGYNLGLTYQLCDDYVSIWGNKEKSGKDELADIREKKKTLPVMYLYEKSPAEDKQKLEELYGTHKFLSGAEINLVKDMLDKSGAKEYLLSKAKESLNKIEESIEALSISEENKAVLRKINEALFPVLYESEEVCS